MSGAVKLLGIVNITEDSFFDGGRYLAPDAAIAHARHLRANAADILDLGAASSNPDAIPVSAETEIGRLAPVVNALRCEGASISIDSFSPTVQRWALAQDVDFLNNIRGFPAHELYPVLAASSAKLIVMHAAGGRASHAEIPAEFIFDLIVRFFEERLCALEAAGIARERLILDPGMGFFLGSRPEASLVVLRRIGELKAAFGLPVLVSVSRKSFLRALVGKRAAQSGAATLSAELFAARQGADYIRTHDTGALADGLTVANALDEPGRTV